MERDNDADVVNDIPADGIGKVEGEDYVDASAGVRYEDFQDDGDVYKRHDIDHSIK